MTSQKTEKPTGVKILAGIQFAYAAFVFAMIFAVGYILNSFLGGAISSAVALTAFVTAILAVAGALAIIMGIGLFTGKKWARTVVRILSIIELIFAILSFNIIGIALYAFILYYMGTPHVKAYFEGRTVT